MVMYRDWQRPTTVRDESGSRTQAVEDHGWVVSANIGGAAFYRQAQQATDASSTVKALRLAVAADPSFALAVADLAALAGAPPGPTGGLLTGWERHHIEVVRSAAADEVSRATDLLREHLASVGCDPLALRIVTDLRPCDGDRDGLEDLKDRLPGCHRAP